MSFRRQLMLHVQCSGIRLMMIERRKGERNKEASESGGGRILCGNTAIFVARSNSCVRLRSECRKPNRLILHSYNARIRPRVAFAPDWSGLWRCFKIIHSYYFYEFMKTRTLQYRSSSNVAWTIHARFIINDLWSMSVHHRWFMIYARSYHQRFMIYMPVYHRWVMISTCLSWTEQCMSPARHADGATDAPLEPVYSKWNNVCRCSNMIAWTIQECTDLFVYYACLAHHRCCMTYTNRSYTTIEMMSQATCCSHRPAVL